MTALAPGVRVFVGWTPDHLCAEPARALRCSVGTLIAGPFEKGSRPFPDRRWRLGGRGWLVNIGGTEVAATECILSPIDDGDGPDAVDRAENLRLAQLEHTRRAVRILRESERCS